MKSRAEASFADIRRKLHAAIVGAMEHRYVGRLSQHAERLAHHAVRGEAWEKAVTHLWRQLSFAIGRRTVRPVQEHSTRIAA